MMTLHLTKSVPVSNCSSEVFHTEVHVSRSEMYSRKKRAFLKIAHAVNKHGNAARTPQECAKKLSGFKSQAKLKVRFFLLHSFHYKYFLHLDPFLVLIECKYFKWFLKCH